MPPKKARTRLSTLGETPAKSSTGTSGTDVKIVTSGGSSSSGVETVKAEVAAEILHSPSPSPAPASDSASNADEHAFLGSLSSIERNVCLIAEEHLQTSFDLSRSNGYINWKKDNKK
jgi:hypothetical protein